MAHVPIRASGARRSDRAKLVVALALLVVAAGVFAYFQGWIGGGSAEQPPGATQEQLAALERQKAETQKQVESGKATKVGDN